MPQPEEIHGRPGLESSRVPADRHSVVATLGDPEAARLVVEELEQAGVPPGSIALPGVLPPEADNDPGRMPEGKAFADLTKSAIAGGIIGAVLGGVVGALLTLVVDELSLVWAIVIGAVFGAGIGGSAGGMAIAKFNSPAWRETYETTDEGPVQVGVHDADPDVISIAERVMRRHGEVEVRRPERGP